MDDTKCGPGLSEIDNFLQTYPNTNGAINMDTNTIYQFIGDCENGQPCKIKGDFWIFIKHESFAMACAEAKELIEYLYSHMRDFNVNCLRCCLDEKMCLRICIPAQMYGGEKGELYLPEIHKEMFRRIISKYYHEKKYLCENIWNRFDTGIYEMTKPYTLPQKNCIFQKGIANIELTWRDICEREEPELRIMLDNFDGNRKVNYDEPKESGLVEVYQAAIRSVMINRNHSIRMGILQNCAFFQYCQWKMNILTKEEWEVFIRIVRYFCAEYLKEVLIHDYERSPMYNKSISDKYISLEDTETNVACEEVKTIFSCPKDCKCLSMVNTAKSEINKANDNFPFVSKEDGLYKVIDIDNGQLEKISSPIKVLGRIKNTDETGYGRLVQFTNFEGRDILKVILQANYVGRGDAVIAELCDVGFEISKRKYIKDIIGYIFDVKAEKMYIRIKKLGWHHGKFIFPDQILGNDNGDCLYYDGNDRLFRVSGTLEEWKKKIGNYCIGNTLMILVTIYALTPPLLSKLDIQGGGLHLYGPSSSGKTSLALLAGSVCGGDPLHGFIRSWRTTDNALEKIAEYHNDNFLVLDEIGQVSSRALFDVTYMLAGNRGKDRATKDVQLREAPSWFIQFLSTGETTIGEKIAETREIFAGQEVRVIELPIDLNKDINAFGCSHDLNSSGDMSNYIKKVSKQIYGAPLRAFISSLCGNNETELNKNIKYIEELCNDCINEFVPKKASPQIFRVAMQFGLMYGVGIFAAEHHILPYTPDNIKDVVRTAFQCWLELRGSLDNLEMDKAVKKLDEYIEKYGNQRFIGSNQGGHEKYINKFSGYTTREANGKLIYYFLPSIFRDVAGCKKEKYICDYLKSKGRLALTNTGEQKTTIYVKSDICESAKNCKIIGVIEAD